LRGFNFVMEASMTDVFENHKINAGIFGLSNLSQSNFFVQYEFLKKRFDFRGKYERQFLSMQTENAEHNYVMNIFQASISYPFNITSRLTITPFYANTRFINLQALSIPDEVEQYAGSNIEFVYDRSLITGLNMRQGTRFKIRLERYIGLNNSDRNFGNLSFDFRNYKRLYRSIIFATRVGYGQFFGNAKKNYLLGGAQNWLFNKTKEHKNATDNPLAVNPETSNVDQLFMKYVTPLRGFDYNKWYGNKYLVLNAELRFPLVKVFSHKTITSNFLRNLQLVAFTDIGSTWTGLSPFNKENSLTTEIIQVDPFVARVSNFQNPFLIGYGSGIRTMFLGYYTKFDVAWGLQNYKTRPKPKYYFTIGHDF